MTTMAEQNSAELDSENPSPRVYTQKDGVGTYSPKVDSTTTADASFIGTVVSAVFPTRDKIVRLSYDPAVEQEKAVRSRIARLLLGE